MDKVYHERIPIVLYQQNHASNQVDKNVYPCVHVILLLCSTRHSTRNMYM
jgi:hypothetical protein